jgi:hypothetical protein
MGKLYDVYEKLKLDDNSENNSRLIYTLAAIETKFDFKYSIERGNNFNQFWLYTRIKGSKGESSILLQATQYSDGKVELSIQGLSQIEDIENWINYTNSDIFMEYLKYF